MLRRKMEFNAVRDCVKRPTKMAEVREGHLEPEFPDEKLNIAICQNTGTPRRKCQIDTSSIGRVSMMIVLHLLTRSHPLWLNSTTVQSQEDSVSYMTRPTSLSLLITATLLAQLLGTARIVWGPDRLAWAVRLARHITTVASTPVQQDQGRI